MLLLAVQLNHDESRICSLKYGNVNQIKTYDEIKYILNVFVMTFHFYSGSGLFLDFKFVN